MKYKRIVISLLLIVLLMPFIIKADTFQAGDVDGNNSVDASDYILVRKHLLKISLLSDNNLKRADVNADNDITSTDYIFIRKKILGYKITVPVKEILLNNSNANLKTGESINLISTINPIDATNKTITWTSSDSAIAKVDNNGLVTALKSGTVTITATSDGNKTATCKVSITNNQSSPIVPSDYTTKYEGSTLKYYIQSKSTYYLTYIWMEDPYNQIRKIEANVAKYGKVMTDDELASEGKKLNITSVPDMLNNYLNNGMIGKDKAFVAFNASGYWNSSWTPPKSYYTNRSDSWLVVTDGVVTRNKPDDANLFDPRVIGITSSGNLKVYDITTNKDLSVSQGVYNEVIKDGVKNTWSFYPELIKNGKNVMWDDSKKAMRQAICQVDSNNYIMFSSKYNYSKKRLEVANILYDLGCQEAFNLDGGGSTTVYYKKPDKDRISKLMCNNNASGGCRGTVEGIYFVEK